MPAAPVPLILLSHVNCTARRAIPNDKRRSTLVETKPLLNAASPVGRRREST